jgi:hypothetical protein
MGAPPQGGWGWGVGAPAPWLLGSGEKGGLTENRYIGLDLTEKMYRLPL